MISQLIQKIQIDVPHGIAETGRKKFQHGI